MTPGGLAPRSGASNARPAGPPQHADERDPDRFRDTGHALARERFSESNDWFWAMTAFGGATLAIVLALAIPTYGWMPFLLVGVTALLGPLALIGGREVPATMYAVAHFGWLVLVGVAASVTGGSQSFLLALIVGYSLGFYSRLAPGVATRYAVVSFVVAVGIVVVSDWDGFVRSPWLVLGCSVGFQSITLFARRMAAGEIRQRRDATVDQLTGLLNRRGLDDRFAEIREQAAVLGDDTPLAVILGDLDHFKSVNDTYGHQRGDDVLRDVAYIIRKSLRRFELVYRMGGEEFLIVLPGHDLAAAAVTAEAVRAAVEAERPAGVEITISMGVSGCPAATNDPAHLLALADSALYEAKCSGRNRAVVSEFSAGAPSDDTTHVVPVELADRHYQDRAHRGDRPAA